MGLAMIGLLNILHRLQGTESGQLKLEALFSKLLILTQPI